MGRKEEFDRQLAIKQREEARAKALEMKLRRERDEARMKEQQRRREEQQRKRLELERKMIEAKAELQKMGTDLRGLNVGEMNVEDRQKLIEETRAKAIREAHEVEKKIASHAKRLDALVRALRAKERPMLSAAYRNYCHDRESLFYTAFQLSRTDSKKAHQQAISSKSRFLRALPLSCMFEKSLLTRWGVELHG